MAILIPRNLNSKSIKSRTWFFFVAIIGASLLVVSVFPGLMGGWESIGDVAPPEHGSLISLEQVQLIWQEIIDSPSPPVTRENVELWNEIYECHVRLEGSLELLEKEVGVQYAGLFVDSRRGIIYVGLVKPTKEQMESIIKVMRPSSKVKIVFYEARFTLRQLEEAADKITARLDELNQAKVPIRGWGVDVVKNKIIVDFEELREEYKTIVRQIVGEDIPIEFKKVGPYVLTSKTARYRPVFGGIRVTTSAGWSTLGFAASRTGVSGFVMTGHAGGVGTSVYQPTIAANNLVGTIAVNPPGPRYSDASWVSFANVRGWIYSSISNTGYDYVVGTLSSAVGGSVIMQGVASCGVSGTITAVDYTVSGHPVFGTLYDQVVANYQCDFGDSGGPTYRIVRYSVKPDYPHYAAILGIHWGFSDDDGDGVWDPGEPSYYSPICGVERDLGITVITYS